MNIPCLGVMENDEAGAYLAIVQREAAATPRLIVARSNNLPLSVVPDIPQTTNEENRRISLLSGLQDDWQQSTLAHFSALRTSLTRLREKQESRFVGSSAHYREHLHRKATKVPPLKASESWHVFCFGSGTRAPCSDHMSCALLPSLLRCCEGDGQSGYIATSHNRPALPSVSLILQFDQILTQRVLSHHVRWFEELQKQHTLTSGWREDMKTTWCLPERCRWAYALLVNLASPLHRDTLADIRRLYVASADLYDIGLELESGDVNVRALSIICVVAGRHFEQAPVLPSAIRP